MSDETKPPSEEKLREWEAQARHYLRGDITQRLVAEVRRLRALLRETCDLTARCHACLAMKASEETKRALEELGCAVEPEL